MLMNGFRVLALVSLLAFFAYVLGVKGMPSVERLAHGTRIETISRGGEVAIAEHLSKTGLTIVEFTADW